MRGRHQTSARNPGPTLIDGPGAPPLTQTQKRAPSFAFFLAKGGTLRRKWAWTNRRPFGNRLESIPKYALVARSVSRFTPNRQVAQRTSQRTLWTVARWWGRVSTPTPHGALAVGSTGPDAAASSE
jgi:hypothetical protein